MRDMVWGCGDWIPQILSNLFGFLALIAVAYVAGWYKSQPWRKPPATPSGGAPDKPSARPQERKTDTSNITAEVKEQVRA